MIISRCPIHGPVSDRADDNCKMCSVAVDINNMSRHKFGRCDRKCRSLEHYKMPAVKDRGTLGKSGILVYYADGTTNADRLPEEA